MHTFHFDTGVNATQFPPRKAGHIERGGTVQIPFQVPNSVPEDAILLYCCDNPDMPDAKRPEIIVSEIYNTALVSKYAYFKRKA